jgi:hypothetical protein
VALRPVYSVQLYVVAGLQINANFQSPTGAVTVIRCVDVYEESGANPVNLLIENPAGGGWLRFQTGATVQSQSGHWEGRQVMVGAQNLLIRVIGGQWSIWMSGYELPTP